MRPCISGSGYPSHSLSSRDWVELNPAILALPTTPWCPICAYIFVPTFCTVWNPISPHLCLPALICLVNSYPAFQPRLNTYSSLHATSYNSSRTPVSLVSHGGRIHYLSGSSTDLFLHLLYGTLLEARGCDCSVPCSQPPAP